MNKYGIIILAAGSSSRMGVPKQLLAYNGKSLIRHIIDVALRTEKNAVAVVTGANYQYIDSEISDLDVISVHNENWEEGMSTSIKKGVAVLLESYPDLEGLLFTVCDQPFITAEILKQLILKSEETGKGIVASKYDEISGTPIFFKKNYFDDLLKLDGNGGAQSILKKYDADVTNIPFSLGNIDIDTPDDYNKLLNTEFE